MTFRAIQSYSALGRLDCDDTEVNNNSLVAKWAILTERGFVVFTNF